ncbi:unnamed protein product [Calypogeia fissa]
MWEIFECILEKGNAGIVEWDFELPHSWEPNCWPSQVVKKRQLPSWAKISTKSDVGDFKPKIRLVGKKTKLSEILYGAPQELTAVRSLPDALLDNDEPNYDVIEEIQKKRKTMTRVDTCRNKQTYTNWITKDFWPDLKKGLKLMQYKRRAIAYYLKKRYCIVSGLAWDKGVQEEALQLNEECLLFKANPLHEVKEEFYFVEDNRWYGEWNLLDLLNFGSSKDTPIVVDDWAEEEEDEGNTLYTNIMGSKSGELTIGEGTRSLDNIFKLLNIPCL